MSNPTSGLNIPSGDTFEEGGSSSGMNLSTGFVWEIGGTSSGWNIPISDNYQEGGVIVTPSIANYYLSPTGSDSNPGTISSPFLTLTKLASVIQPGQTAYLRGGNYYFNSHT